MTKAGKFGWGTQPVVTKAKTLKKSAIKGPSNGPTPDGKVGSSARRAADTALNTRLGSSATVDQSEEDRAIADARAHAGFGPDGKPLAPTKPTGGGSGPTGSQSPEADAYTKQLFDQYTSDLSSPLQSQLKGFTDQAQATGNKAIGDLQSQLAGQTNPYQHLQQATQNTNPMAEYMRATGASTAQTDALVALMNGQSSERVAAGNQMQDQLGQSWSNAQQGRQADAATSGAAFSQGLAANNASNQAQISAGEKARKDALAKQILEMSLTHGVDLKKLGVKL